MKKRFTEEQVIGILRQADGVVIRDLCRKHNITEQTFFRWRNKFGGMTVSEARRLKELESENALGYQPPAKAANRTFPIHA